MDYTALVQRPTYMAFIKLLDNYNASIGEAEEVTEDEKRENDEFIHCCMSTRVHHNDTKLQKVCAGDAEGL